MTQLLAVYGSTPEARRSLARFFWRRVKKAADVDDLVQEVYRRLIRVSDSREAEIRCAEAYTMEIAKHVLADFRIEEESNDKWVIYDDETVEDAIDKGIRETVDFVTPETSLESEQEVRELLSRLPVKHRKVIEMHKIEGYSYEETAEILGLSVFTVEKYVTQGLRILRGKISSKEMLAEDKRKAEARLERKRERYSMPVVPIQVSVPTPSPTPSADVLPFRSRYDVLVDIHVHIDDDSPRTFTPEAKAQTKS